MCFFCFHWSVILRLLTTELGIFNVKGTTAVPIFGCSHSVGAHSNRLWCWRRQLGRRRRRLWSCWCGRHRQPQTDSQFDTPETDNENCEVCLIAHRNPRIALVPCGHQRFCSTCADRVRDEGRGCLICRTDISFVLNLYWSDWTVQLFELFWLDWTVSLMELNCFCTWPIGL